MSRAGASRVNPASYVPTTFFELAKIAASGRLGQIAAALKLTSAAWVLYLAFRLWSAPGPVSAADVSARDVLITTLLNPKAIIIGLTMIPAANVSTQIPRLITLAVVVAVASMLWLAFGKLVIGEQKTLPTLVRRCSCAVLMLFSASLNASLFS
ncbi:threonine transporter RhtB [Rhizobium mongolense]|uniref:Threonine/homoserine/homoserine lactone efflux protein n=1 Tax=Rhizobium mongolense TaxID=57676 RepID=A0A7W6WIE1_9HYPH|nr:threonine transporter RhtB [Rhizobium mongolense]MBB4279231.1 threonine/homoserine/homoserine lactone efflux protein [Rhizobium mongolense]